MTSAAVHVGQLLQPVPGGIGRYVRHLLEALPAAGVDVHPFAAGPAPAGVDSYTDLGQPRGTLRYEAWHRFRRPIIHVPGDVVHATSLAIPPTGGRPLVVTVHDLVFLRQPEHLTRRGVSFHRRGLAIARREAAAVIVPSEFTKADLAGEGFEESRIHVAPHGVEITKPLPEEDLSKRLARMGVRRPFVLFVGTIEPRKGVHDLLSAYEAIRSDWQRLELVLAGPPGWGEQPDLDRQGVITTGNVGDDDLEALYQSALVLVLPERYSGFGLPVIEGMARGCPAVVTDAGSLPEVAGDAGVVVSVGDVDALADGLSSIVGDRDYRDELSVRARRRAATFTWERSAAAHRQAYEAAMS